MFVLRFGKPQCFGYVFSLFFFETQNTSENIVKYKYIFNVDKENSPVAMVLPGIPKTKFANVWF